MKPLDRFGAEQDLADVLRALLKMVNAEQQG